MLVAKCRRRSEVDREQVIEEEREFDKVGELEDYIAYHRAYIVTLSFEGQLGEEEEMDAEECDGCCDSFDLEDLTEHEESGLRFCPACQEENEEGK